MLRTTLRVTQELRSHCVRHGSLLLVLHGVLAKVCPAFMHFAGKQLHAHHRLQTFECLFQTTERSHKQSLLTMSANLGHAQVFHNTCPRCCRTWSCLSLRSQRCHQHCTKRQGRIASSKKIVSIGLQYPISQCVCCFTSTCLLTSSARQGGRDREGEAKKLWPKITSIRGQIWHFWSCNRKILPLPKGAP